MPPLLPRIHTYLTKTTTGGKWVTKEQIQTLATSKGYTPLDVLDALGDIGKLKDIEVRVHKDTTVYRMRQAPVVKAPPPARIPYTPEQIAMSQDCFDNCPFYTDEEREAHRTSFKDRTDRQHEITLSPSGYNVEMERKYGVHKWQRMKQERAII
jgi:hypothetical protein